MSQHIEFLKKKLKEYETERVAVQGRIAKDSKRYNDLTSAIAGIENVLRVEGVSLSPPPALQPPPTAVPAATNGSGPNLPDVLKEVMADFKARTEHELIDLAKQRGVDFGGKEPRRTVAFTLMGIARGKKIQRVKDDLWKRVA